MDQQADGEHLKNIMEHDYITSYKGYLSTSWYHQLNQFHWDGMVWDGYLSIRFLLSFSTAPVVDPAQESANEAGYGENGTCSISSNCAQANHSPPILSGFIKPPKSF